MSGKFSKVKREVEGRKLKFTTGRLFKKGREGSYEKWLKEMEWKGIDWERRLERHERTVGTRTQLFSCLFSYVSSIIIIVIIRLFLYVIVYYQRPTELLSSPRGMFSSFSIFSQLHFSIHHFIHSHHLSLHSLSLSQSVSLSIFPSTIWFNEERGDVMLCLSHEIVSSHHPLQPCVLSSSWSSLPKRLNELTFTPVSILLVATTKWSSHPALLSWVHWLPHFAGKGRLPVKEWLGSWVTRTHTRNRRLDFSDSGWI